MQFFQCWFSAKPPAVACSGGLVCRKLKLKNFYDPKTAGGCGVVPFLSAPRLFCGCTAAPALRRASDRFVVLHAGGLSADALMARYGASGEKA
ncbi:hypothetical protein C2U54_01265 [Leclercia sp. LSNIH1]|nr:hypothetical protein C2U54_01265 [Leclercia sp. LSNIH1]POV34753.1 hypothetical protein C3388_09290 [Leclercia sp. LSNIH5]POW63047.1 hypothetical protein C3389_19880 [Leclercia sp. LSNIH2]